MREANALRSAEWDATLTFGWDTTTDTNRSRYKPLAPPLAKVGSAALQRPNSGSSWCKKRAHLSSSSASPIAPALWRKASRERRKLAVGLVSPTHIARTPPSGCPQGVEPTVVSDAGVGTRLDIVTGELCERCPRLEIARVAGRDRLCRLQTGRARLIARSCEGSCPLPRWRWEDCLGEALAQIDREIIRHSSIFAAAERPTRRGISFHDMKNRRRHLETPRGALVGLCLCLVLAGCGRRPPTWPDEAEKDHHNHDHDPGPDPAGFQADHTARCGRLAR